MASSWIATCWSAIAGPCYLTGVAWVSILGSEYLRNARWCSPVGAPEPSCFKTYRWRGPATSRRRRRNTSTWTTVPTAVSRSSTLCILLVSKCYDRVCVLRDEVARELRASCGLSWLCSAAWNFKWNSYLSSSDASEDCYGAEFATWPTADVEESGRITERSRFQCRGAAHAREAAFGAACLRRRGRWNVCRRVRRLVQWTVSSRRCPRGLKESLRRCTDLPLAASKGERLLAVWLHRCPVFGRFGAEKLPLGWRALKNWRLLSFTSQYLDAGAMADVVASVFKYHRPCSW